MRLKGRMIADGNARGEVLITDDPIGFYGGIEAATGKVLEKGHPLEGEYVRDRVLVFPTGKGSTVGSYVIYGLKANGAAPAAIINRETDTITATGVILAEIPCVDRIDLGRLKAGQMVRVLGSEGVVEVIEE